MAVMGTLGGSTIFALNLKLLYELLRKDAFSGALSRVVRKA
jgi:hypothetical protein